jgi:predicted Zn-dependent protease
MVRSRSKWQSGTEVLRRAAPTGPAPKAFSRWTRPGALLLAAVALGGCYASLPSERTGALPDAPKALAAPTPQQREHARILAAYGGIYEHPGVQVLLRQTVDRLVAASPRPDLRYDISILNSPAINAFALPSGNLYVTRGLLALANDSSELASVLAHEMAHVIVRHAAIREDRVRQAAIVSRVANDLLSDPQMGALALAKSKIALATFSRTQELEADGIGVGISARAGFDPYGAMRFLTSMDRNAELKNRAAGGDGRAPDFLSSHPANPERVKHAQSSARQFSAPGLGTRGDAEYLESLDGLVYGEDPNDGMVRGRHYLHPKLGFAFTAPEGFALDISGAAVFGMNEKSGLALRLDVVRAPEQELAAYLTSGWIENIDARSVEELTVNGLAAATATAKGDQWTFRLYALRSGEHVYRFLFAARSRTPELDRVFREAIGSFRAMTEIERDSVKPLRLRVVTVQPGDTVERLAARMALPERAAERFRLLNGLRADESLKPGDQVKIVVE